MGSCCGGSKQANREYEVTLKHDGSVHRVASLAEARIMIDAAPKRGTVKAVPIRKL